LGAARQSLGRRKSVAIVLAVFLAVQVEWAVVMGLGFLGKG